MIKNLKKIHINFFILNVFLYFFTYRQSHLNDVGNFIFLLFFVFILFINTCFFLGKIKNELLYLLCSLFYLFFIFSSVTTNHLMFVFKPENSNIIYNYSYNSFSNIFLHISYYSSFICLSYKFFDIISSKNLNFKIKNTFLKLESFILNNANKLLVFILLFILVKFYFIYQGYIGSLSNTSLITPFHVRIILPFLISDLFCIYTLVVLYCNNRINNFSIVIYFASFMFLSILEGDRRDILGIFILIYCAKYIHNYQKIKFNFKSFIFILISILFFLFGSIYGFVLGNIGVSEFSYFSIFIEVLTNTDMYVNSGLISRLLFNIISTFNITYLIDTAINLKEYGYDVYIFLPKVYASNLIPFSSLFFDDIISGSHLQAPLFFNSINNAYGKPYLILPQICELILFSEWYYAFPLYIILNIAFITLLIHSTRLSSMFNIFIITFITNFSMSLTSSILTNIIVPVKIFILLFILYVVLHLCRIKTKKRI